MVTRSRTRRPSLCSRIRSVGLIQVSYKKMAQARLYSYVFICVGGVVVKLVIPKTLRHYPKPLTLYLAQNHLDNQFVPRHCMWPYSVHQLVSDFGCESVCRVQHCRLLVCVVLQLAVENFFDFFLYQRREEPSPSVFSITKQKCNSCLGSLGYCQY